LSDLARNQAIEASQSLPLFNALDDGLTYFLYRRPPQSPAAGKLRPRLPVNKQSLLQASIFSRLLFGVQF
jgi:hypothetical protein